MRRPGLRLLLSVLIASCAQPGASVEAPAPVPEPISVPIPATPLPAPAAPGVGSESEYRGAYTRGLEASWFAPCDTPRDDALWWVTLTEDARLQRDSMLSALKGPPTGALAVRWRGTISARMRAGHMGRGTRYMLVTEILEVRPLRSEGACRPMQRTS